MTEVEEIQAMLAARKRAAQAQDEEQAAIRRIRLRDDLRAGRLEPVCACSYCIGEILALREPNRWECARRNALKRPDGHNENLELL